MGHLSTPHTSVDIEGKDAGAKRELLGAIRSRFAEIYEDFNRKIEFKELIPCNCPECLTEIVAEEEPHYFDWATVQRYARKGLKKIRCERSLDEVCVANLMGQVGGGSEVSPLDFGAAEPVREKKEKPRVFLSYCHDDDKEVTRPHAALTQAGMEVWWDKELLAGQDWETEIHRAMKRSDVVALCLSEKSMKRKKSGIYPEADKAIREYRLRPPSEIYLIPLKLSECEIPDIKINETARLDSLQHVDLFPKRSWESGIEKILKSIRTDSSE